MPFKNITNTANPNIHVIMDYSHVMKKIRNNISKSGTAAKHTRLLVNKGREIKWEHWYRAYMWDLSTNPFKVYHQLTQEHMFLNPQLKMRNKLAEDVLNENMLHLMKCYQASLGDKGTEIQGSVNLLEKTSVLVKFFRDSRSVTNSQDIRLVGLKDVHQWFREWESVEKGDRKSESRLMSYQTREDVTSLIVGFTGMCSDRLRRYPGSSIVPNRVNSDIVENVFCQQRGIHNGANTNPTYVDYSRTMNTIILGQASLSRKSNAASSGAHMYR